MLSICSSNSIGESCYIPCIWCIGKLRRICVISIDSPRCLCRSSQHNSSRRSWKCTRRFHNNCLKSTWTRTGISRRHSCSTITLFWSESIHITRIRCFYYTITTPMKFIIFTSRTRLFRWPCSFSVAIGSRKGSDVCRIVSHIRHIRYLIISIGWNVCAIKIDSIFIFIIIDDTYNIFIGIIVGRSFKYYLVRCSCYSSDWCIIWEYPACSIECTIIKRNCIIACIHLVEHIIQWCMVFYFGMGNSIIIYPPYLTGGIIVGRTTQYKITIKIEIIICFAIIIIILIEIYFS